MIYIRILITLLITLNLAAYANAESRTKKRSLKDIKSGQNYKVRLRTGNLELDKRVYSAALDSLSEYLPISNEVSYTGFIEVIFSSTLGQGILGSKPAYSTTVEYGDK